MNQRDWIGLEWNGLIDPILKPQLPGWPGIAGEHEYLAGQ